MCETAPVSGREAVGSGRQPALILRRSERAPVRPASPSNERPPSAPPPPPPLVGGTAVGIPFTVKLTAAAGELPAAFAQVSE
jgi:hypothetical protein